MLLFGEPGSFLRCLMPTWCGASLAVLVMWVNVPPYGSALIPLVPVLAGLTLVSFLGDAKGDGRSAED